MINLYIIYMFRVICRFSKKMQRLNEREQKKQDVKLQVELHGAYTEGNKKYYMDNKKIRQADTPKP